MRQNIGALFAQAYDGPRSIPQLTIQQRKREIADPKHFGRFRIFFGWVSGHAGHLLVLSKVLEGQSARKMNITSDKLIFTCQPEGVRATKRDGE